ncbi:MAG: DUF4097 family beta strand repeat protein [Candidatus Aminicenantes bacterium]|nr:MAG: DUF4097 family beta strand repeat protein [Candidatus Aminicenantes bacterium]
MKHFKLFGQKTLLLVLMLSLLFLNVQAGDKKEVNKTFKPKEIVDIKVVSGDCVIKKGNNSEIKVHLVYTYPPDKFEPVFEEKGNTLILKEEFHKTEGKCNIHGESHWTVTVPEKTNIEFKAASGDLDVAGLKSSISAKLASGDVTVKDFKGKIKLKAASGELNVSDSTGEMTVGAASGDIELSNVKGTFNVKAASGDIDASGIEFNEPSNFEAVSGEVLVKLAKSSTVDLNLKTVSGDITLDYNGNPVKGYFKFKGMKGNIHSDIPFDNKEGSKYSPFVKKYFKKGDSPEITLKAVSGDLTFKK